MNSMSNRFERESEHAGEGRSSTSMMHLLGQMLMLPFTVFVYGMEVFVKTIKGMQKVTDRGMDVMAGGTTAQHGFSRDEDQKVKSIRSPRPEQTRPGDVEVAKTTSSGDGSLDNAEAKQKETVQMIDRNLSDDQLKLVRFKVLFVKRDYETAFREQEALVPDNMTGEAFTAWKVAEFIQEIGQGHTEAPKEWPKDDHGKPKYPKEDQAWRKVDEKWYLLSLPEKDKKYLRVYYEVLDRYVREEEDDEVVVLKEIRDAIIAHP